MKITGCSDCPFISGEQEDFCNHPLSPLERGPINLKYVDNRWVLENPKYCPLRSLKQIDIGCIVEIDLDTNLFQENFKK